MTNTQKIRAEVKATQAARAARRPHPLDSDQGGLILFLGLAVVMLIGVMATS